MTPRPILKTRQASYSSWSEYFPSPSTALPFRYPTTPHVHFPPTPTLTDTQMTHSPLVYDRAPIVVVPNACKLPERGGRDYSAYGIVAAPPSVPSWRSRGERSYFDARTSCHEDEDENPPPLVHDHSSESEDEDACISSPVHTGDFDAGIPKPHIEVEDTAFDSRIVPPPPPRTLAFLPHPHESDPEGQPLRRPKLKRKQTSPRARSLSLGATKDTFGGADNEFSLNGCLGGF